MINFTATKEESEVIMEIVKRAESLGVQRDRINLLMDIEAVHSNCPLRLREFLEADNFNFMHDVCGIIRHLNRETGELKDCFLPRFAQRRD